MKILIPLLLLFFSTAVLAEVTELITSVDRNPVRADESVMLQVTAVGNPDRDAIDFSVLESQFRVSAPSVSQSTQIINGRRSSSVSWRVNLFPLAQGDLVIPAFEMDGKRSQPIKLTVLSPDDNSGQPREYFLTTDINNRDIYLQQQVVYTVRIHLANEIQSGSLSEPVLEGAIIEKLGEDKEFQDLIDGVRYRIIERKFAIIPQSSGEFTVKSPLFEARVLSGTSQRLAYFSRTKTINRAGPEQTINVKPIPTNYQYTWLPSELVKIEESWQGDTDSIFVGEPITRTITLTALGLLDEQLPEIQPAYHPSFKTYPEQPQNQSIQQNDRLIAQTVVNTAIIAEQAGNFVLPEVRVPWFNVNTEKTEFAIIPARSIEVQGNAGLQQAPVVSTQPVSPDTSSTSEVQYNPQNVVREPEDSKLFDWLHLLLFSLVLVLSGALGMLLSTNRAKQPEKLVTKDIDSEELAWDELRTCIESRKLNRLSTSLTTWMCYLFNKRFFSASEGLQYTGNAEIKTTYNKVLKSQYSVDDTEELDEALVEFLQHLSSIRQQIVQQQSRGKAKPLSRLIPFAVYWQKRLAEKFSY